MIECAYPLILDITGGCPTYWILHIAKGGSSALFLVSIWEIPQLPDTLVLQEYLTRVFLCDIE